MVRNPPDPGPLSRRFDVSIVRDVPLTFTVTASETERRALASEAGIVGVDTLTADLEISREGREGVRVTGIVRALVHQTCVVSLDEIASQLEEPVDVVFLPEAEVARMAEERAVASAGPDHEAALDDVPDPIVAGRIDLGALAAEIMILGLDPYPRKPGAAFEDTAPPSEVVSPFAALRPLKDNDSP